MAEARERLEALIDRYDDPGQAYLSHPIAAAAPRFADYALLARVAEWNLLIGDAEEEEP